MRQLRTWQHLLLGGVSGAVAASATMPLDYIKTAMQCGSPLGVKELVRLTLREKGASGLFAGMVRLDSDPSCTWGRAHEGADRSCGRLLGEVCVTVWSP